MKAPNVLTALAVAAVLAATAPAKVHAQPVLTLEAACAAADRAHEKIRAARAAEDAAAVAPWRAVSAMAPSVVDTGSYVENKDGIAFPLSPVPAGFNPLVLAEQALRNTLAITQPVYTHQFWALRDLGRAQVERAAGATRAARQDVRLAVTAAYYDVLRAQALSKVAAEAQRMARAESERASARAELGSAMRVDVARAEAQAAVAAQQVVEAEGNLVAARAALARLADADAPFSVVEPPRPHLGNESLAALREQARTGSPDLQQARAGLHASDAESRRRVAALLPSVGLRWSHSLVSEETFADRSNFWTLQVGVEVPLVESGGARYLDVAEQRANARGTAASVAGFERDLMVDVEKASITVHTLAAKEEAADKEALLADEAYRLLSEQYAAGASTNLDVLTALANRTAAQANRESVHYGFAVALAQLDRITGRMPLPAATPEVSR